MVQDFWSVIYLKSSTPGWTVRTEGMVCTGWWGRETELQRTFSRLGWSRGGMERCWQVPSVWWEDGKYFEEPMSEENGRQCGVEEETVVNREAAKISEGEARRALKRMKRGRGGNRSWWHTCGGMEVSRRMAVEQDVWGIEEKCPGADF